MLARIFLLFVAAGIVFGSIILGFSHFGAALFAMACLGILTWVVLVVFSRKRSV